MTTRLEFSDGSHMDMPVCQFAGCTWFVAANEVYCERHRDETDRDEANQAAYDAWQADQQEERLRAEAMEAEWLSSGGDEPPFE